MKHDNIHETPDVSYIQNESVSHEVSDVNVKAIAGFTVGLLLLTLTTMLLMWAFKGFLEKQAAARPEDQRPPMAQTEVEQRQSDIGPRLQLAPGYGVTTADGRRVGLELREPAAEYRVLLSDWKQVLRSGQTDPVTMKQLVLPIDQAKKQLLDSGALKSSANAAPDAYERSEEMPSSSSAGRMNEKRLQ